MKFFSQAILLAISLAVGVAQATPATPTPNIGVPIPVIDPARIEQQLEKPRIRTTAPPRVIADKVKEKPAPTASSKKLKTFKLNGIKLTGSTIFTEQQLRPTYREFLYRQVNMNDLVTITNRINHKYSEAGYVLTKAVLPVQKVTGGIVAIRIIEGKIHDVHIKGKLDDVARRKILSYAKLMQKSAPVKMKVMERYLLLINDLPGLKVKSVLSPEKKVVGGINLTFIVEQKVVEAKVSYDNFGTRYLGPDRIYAEVAANSFIGIDKFGARTLFSPFNNSLVFGQVFYNMPLFNDGTEFDFSVAKTKTRSGFTLKPLKLVGISHQFKAGVVHPFIRSRTKNFDLSLTADWLDSDLYSDVVVPVTKPTIYQDKIRSLRLKGSLDGTDKLKGFNYAMLQLSKGLPTLGASKPNSTARRPLSRANGKSNYTKVNGEIFRLQRIDNYWSFLLGAQGQYSWDPLLSAEEFGFGGRAYGRGYNPSDLIGDRGIAAKAELRLDTALSYALLKHIQYYTFCDAGRIWNIGDNNGQPRSSNATSLGFGARFTFNSTFSGTFEFSKGLTYPIPAEVAAGKSGYDYRGFFSFEARL